MSEKRFKLAYEKGNEAIFEDLDHPYPRRLTNKEVENLLNEQQELIEELQASDEMGWKRAEHFEKKCPKELHNQKMYIKRLEYKVQKFKEENEQLKKARDESDKFIAKKGLGAEFLNWCVANE